jgi:hypothetical protein
LSRSTVVCVARDPLQCPVSSRHPRSNRTAVAQSSRRLTISPFNGRVTHHSRSRGPTCLCRCPPYMNSSAKRPSGYREALALKRNAIASMLKNSEERRFGRRARTFNSPNPSPGPRKAAPLYRRTVQRRESLRRRRLEAQRGLRSTLNRAPSVAFERWMNVFVAHVVGSTKFARRSRWRAPMVH